MPVRVTPQHTLLAAPIFPPKNVLPAAFCGRFPRTIHGTWAAIYTEFVEISVNLFSGKSGASRAENTVMMMERNLFSTTTGAPPVPSGAQPTTTPCRPIR